MYAEDVKDENTHTFLLITSLITNGFSVGVSRRYTDHHQG